MWWGKLTSKKQQSRFEKWLKNQNEYETDRENMSDRK